MAVFHNSKKQITTPRFTEETNQMPLNLTQRKAFPDLFLENSSYYCLSLGRDSCFPNVWWISVTERFSLIAEIQWTDLLPKHKFIL